MASEIELDGCKILKEITWISFAETDKKKIEDIFHRISEQRINLLFASYIKRKERYVNIGIKAECEAAAIKEIEACHPESIGRKKAVILSVFPHKNNPQVVGKILDIYNNSDPEEIIIVNSFSAVSIVCSRKILKQSIKFFFDHFHFKRPVEDWARVYREKEHVCKEVIASYQEKRPKVYFLEYRDCQALIRVEVNKNQPPKHVYKLFAEFLNDTYITFLASSPKKNGSVLLLSVYPYKEKMAGGENSAEVLHNMVAFSMNGPHFGDRYGIVSLLFKAVNEAGVELAGLNCSTHSIIGIMPRNHLKQAIDSISDYFEVPAVIDRTLQG